MEKRRPHYDLARIHALIDNKQSRVITTTAFNTAARLGFGVSEIVACVKQLTDVDFYKSMTTHFDHTRWQDVYRPSFEGYRLYVKLQLSLQDQTVVISFKELENND